MLTQERSAFSSRTNVHARCRLPCAVLLAVRLSHCMTGGYEAGGFLLLPDGGPDATHATTTTRSSKARAPLQAHRHPSARAASPSASAGVYAHAARAAPTQRRGRPTTHTAASRTASPNTSSASHANAITTHERTSTNHKPWPARPHARRAGGKGAQPARPAATGGADGIPVTRWFPRVPPGPHTCPRCLRRGRRTPPPQRLRPSARSILSRIPSRPRWVRRCGPGPHPA